jgi:FeS assembly SUF system regulator
LFRLSKITDYGIVLLAHLASVDDDHPRNARELANEADLPHPVASKILKSLARRGLLTSHRGSKGGFSLVRPADQIHVAEIIEALEGPVALTECSVSIDACSHAPRCRVRDPWQIINRVVQDSLTQITLADLASPSSAYDHPLDQFTDLRRKMPGEPERPQ